ncbi:MAG: divergent polysaccharide deacetylase family protein [Thermodesulfobacteriota bacterium]
MGKKRKKGGRKSGASFSWALILTGFILGFAAAFLVLKYGTMAPVAPPSTASLEKKEPLETMPLPPEKVSLPVARVAILIDDMGGNLSSLKEILSLELPITISVLPRLKHSREVSRIAAMSGRDVLLHLPMEPKNRVVNHPGPGVVLTEMAEPLIRKTVMEDLEFVPEAIGTNNHMGSRFTEDEPAMRKVFTILKERGLFFVDSRTTSASIGTRLATETGIPHATRDVFLDNERDVLYIDGQIKTLVNIARKRGTAIGIGHPYPETLAALKKVLPLLKEEGIEVVPVSELLK